MMRCTRTAGAAAPPGAASGSNGPMLLFPGARQRQQRSNAAHLTTVTVQRCRPGWRASDSNCPALLSGREGVSGIGR